MADGTSGKSPSLTAEPCSSRPMGSCQKAAVEAGQGCICVSVSVSVCLCTLLGEACLAAWTGRAESEVKEE